MGLLPDPGGPAVGAGSGPAAGTVVAPVTAVVPGTVVRRREEEPCP